MRYGLFVSLVLHGAAVGLAFVSLPEGWRPDVAQEPFVPIEVLSEAEIAERTSVPAARPEPEVIEEPEPEPDLPEEEPEPAPVPEENDPEPQPEPEPEPVEPEPEPEPEPEEPEVVEEPQPEPPKEEPKPEPEEEDDELDFDALSQLVDKARDQRSSPAGSPSEVAETADDARRQVGAGDRLTASAKDKMIAAVSRCWQANAIIGAPEPEKLKVIVDIDLNRDGTLSGQPRVVNALQINLSGNRFWKVAEQNAVRAVIACQPYDFLPSDQYEAWREFSLNFDPAQMAGF
ncbi:MAG: cell envelope integrity protein TolA [Pseudomonadota bacterium]